MPLTGITVCKLDDTETRKNAFEISGPMIDTIVAVCQTKTEADNWVSLLQKHSNTSSPLHEPGQPHSLPHVSIYSKYAHLYIYIFIIICNIDNNGDL